MRDAIAARPGLAGVARDVRREGRPPHETLRAGRDGASEGLVTGVESRVGVEVEGLGEGLAAGGAGEGLGEGGHGLREGREGWRGGGSGVDDEGLEKTGNAAAPSTTTTTTAPTTTKTAAT